MTLDEKCYLFSGMDFWQTRGLERLKIPNVTLSDGPHGVRKQEGSGDQLGLNPSLPATCFPTAATIANSWDPALGEEIGVCLGEEAASQGVGVLLGPGLNIKRSPLCGRNFEYFSEDPYLAGKMAAGYIRGIQKNGVAACPKHFAVNSQELRRMASDSVLDECTLREIYLTGFEIAVKEGHAKSIMSSYNRINGVYADENYHLLQEILRDEWGFDGFVVSDWGASNDHVEGVRTGSHLEMPWLPKCKALIHGYLCGQAGAGAMLKALMGEINPSGKLAESYPIQYEDVPSAPYFPSKQRTAEYREGLYVGYRYYESVNVPVLFPFGYGLSYTTFEYSDLKVTGKEVTFTLKNTGKVDGAEIAQLYVSKLSNQIFRPAKELKGFQKVFLKAGESKTVTIPLDDKAFRYFNIESNQFEVEGGTYQISIGASVADIKLSGSVTVAGTKSPYIYDSVTLADYYSGKIKAVSDREFETLLGHPIPDGSWSGTLDMNDAICQLYYAKSWIARLVYKILTNMLRKSIDKGTPDLNITFIYNMPFRGIAKMTGGMCTMEMAEGILIIVNGHFFKGLGQIIGGFFRAGKKRKVANSPNYRMEYMVDYKDDKFENKQ